MFIRVGTCGRNCQFCSGPNKCNQCYPPYSSVNGTCICNTTLGFLTQTGCSPSCVAGEYFNATAKACLDCVGRYPNCQSCNMTNCLSCSVGFFYSVDSNGTGNCVKYCPNNFTMTRINSSNLWQDVCLSCPPNCRTCLPGLCISCNPEYFYYSGYCVTNCPIAYFPNNGYCQRCSLNCFTCNSLACLTCINGFSLTTSGNCVPDCVNSTVIATSSNCNFTCDPVCATCYGSLNIQCLSCTNTSLYYYNGTCLAACPLGLYSVSNQCSYCPSTCLSCTNLTFCLSCLTGYYLSNNQCARTCPISTFPNINNANLSICASCPDNCTRCGNALTCY